MNPLLIIIILILLFMAGLLFPLLWMALPIVILLCVIACICSGIDSLFGESKEAEGQRLHNERLNQIAKTKQMIEDHNEWLRGKS